MRSSRACEREEQSFFQPPSAASGAAEPPRPQGRGLPKEARAARSWGKGEIGGDAMR
ncbi:MAG: hypothetical protein ACI4NF_03645 [Christensenellales bacterium]